MTKILIIGTGAVGGFYGAKLSQAGAEVSVLCRSDYEVVKSAGIKIKSRIKNLSENKIGNDQRDFCFIPKEVLKDAWQYQDKADFILVATKVLPEIPLAKMLNSVMSPQSSIVLLQNGIHIEEEIARTFPKTHLISAIAFIAVSKIAPGVINHQDFGKLIIGDFPRGLSSKTLSLVKLWEDSGISCQVSENIILERWKKLVWNAAFNPISVLGGAVDTKQILANQNTKELAKNAMQEVVNLAESDGFKLPPEIIENNIKITSEMTAYKTSMLLDFEANRPMELEAILGNALLVAKEKNIATPYLTTFYALLSAYSLKKNL